MSDFSIQGPDHDDGDEIDVERAPICSACGVTTLAADAFGTGFACDSDECDLYGEVIG